jgi:hypothetical protein
MSEIGEMIWQNMVAMEDEKMEACIHCGNVWYRIRHRDGVCYQCQKLGKLGRSRLAERKRTIRFALVGGIFVLILLFLHVLR